MPSASSDLHQSKQKTTLGDLKTSKWHHLCLQSCMYVALWKLYLQNSSGAPHTWRCLPITNLKIIPQSMICNASTYSSHGGEREGSYGTRQNGEKWFLAYKKDDEYPITRKTAKAWSLRCNYSTYSTYRMHSFFLDPHLKRMLTITSKMPEMQSHSESYERQERISYFWWRTCSLSQQSINNQKRSFNPQN